MSDAPHGPLQSYVDKWLAVQPQQRVALAFVDPRRRPGHVALAAWEQELLGAAYGGYLGGNVPFEDNAPDVSESYGYLAVPLAQQQAGATFTSYVDAPIPGTKVL